MKWNDDGPYTVTAVGERMALIKGEINSEVEVAVFISHLTPIPDDVTIEISREDAEELLQLAEERDDLKSWLRGSSWIFSSELRLRAKLRAALAGEK